MKQRFFLSIITFLLLFFSISITNSASDNVTNFASNTVWPYSSMGECSTVREDNNNKDWSYSEYDRSECYQFNGFFQYNVCKKGEECIARSDEQESSKITTWVNPFKDKTFESNWKEYTFGMLKEKVSEIISIIGKSKSDSERVISLESIIKNINETKNKEKYKTNSLLQNLVGYIVFEVQTEIDTLKEKINSNQQTDWVNDFLCDISWGCESNTSTWTVNSTVLKCSWTKPTWEGVFLSKGTQSGNYTSWSYSDNTVESYNCSWKCEDWYEKNWNICIKKSIAKTSWKTCELNNLFLTTWKDSENGEEVTKVEEWEHKLYWVKRNGFYEVICRDWKLDTPIMYRWSKSAPELMSCNDWFETIWNFCYLREKLYIYKCWEQDVLYYINWTSNANLTEYHDKEEYNKCSTENYPKKVWINEDWFRPFWTEDSWSLEWNENNALKKDWEKTFDRNALKNIFEWWLPYYDWASTFCRIQWFNNVKEIKRNNDSSIKRYWIYTTWIKTPYSHCDSISSWCIEEITCNKIDSEKSCKATRYWLDKVNWEYQITTKNHGESYIIKMWHKDSTWKVNWKLFEMTCNDWKYVTLNSNFKDILEKSIFTDNWWTQWDVRNWESDGEWNIEIYSKWLFKLTYNWSHYYYSDWINKYCEMWLWETASTFSQEEQKKQLEWRYDMEVLPWGMTDIWNCSDNEWFVKKENSSDTKWDDNNKIYSKWLFKLTYNWSHYYYSDWVDKYCEMWVWETASTFSQEEQKKQLEWRYDMEVLPGWMKDSWNCIDTDIDYKSSKVLTKEECSKIWWVSYINWWKTIPKWACVINKATCTEKPVWCWWTWWDSSISKCKTTNIVKNKRIYWWIREYFETYSCTTKIVYDDRLVWKKISNWFVKSGNAYEKSKCFDWNNEMQYWCGGDKKNNPWFEDWYSYDWKKLWSDPKMFIEISKTNYSGNRGLTFCKAKWFLKKDYSIAYNRVSWFYKKWYLKNIIICSWLSSNNDNNKIYSKWLFKLTYNWSNYYYSDWINKYCEMWVWETASTFSQEEQKRQLEWRYDMQVLPGWMTDIWNCSDYDDFVEKEDSIDSEKLCELNNLFLTTWKDSENGEEVTKVEEWEHKLYWVKRNGFYEVICRDWKLDTPIIYRGSNSAPELISCNDWFKTIENFCYKSTNLKYEKCWNQDILYYVSWNKKANLTKYHYPEEYKKCTEYLENNISNWVCNNTKANSCTSWKMSYWKKDTSTYWYWTCNWSNWWKTVTNCAKAKPVIWVCNNTKANSCTSWKMSYWKKDTSTYWYWTCNWSNWWKTVTNCAKKKD